MEGREKEEEGMRKEAQSDGIHICWDMTQLAAR